MSIFIINNLSILHSIEEKHTENKKIELSNTTRNIIGNADIIYFKIEPSHTFEYRKGR